MGIKRILFPITLFLLVGFLIIPTVGAITEHNYVYYDQSASNTDIEGYRIYAVGTSDLVKITKHPSVDASACYLHNDSYSLVSSGTFTGDNCSITGTLEQGKYYHLSMNKAGSPFTHYYNTTIAYPIYGTNIQWVNGSEINGHTIYSTRGGNILSIDISSDYFIEYNQTVFKTSYEMFSLINITNSTAPTNAILNYNGVEYEANVYSLGNNNYTIRSNIEVPNTAGSYEFFFQWNIGASTETSENRTQQVNSLAIDDCSVYSTMILNYTLRDEESQSILSGSAENTTIEVDIDIFFPTSQYPVAEYSHEYDKTNPATVCIDSLIEGTTLNLDAVARYQSVKRDSELYHIQNYELTDGSIPNHINLYDLNSSKSKDFLITFRDSNFLPVEDALIVINRKYISEGVFKSVEIPKTDLSGQAIGHFVESEAIYSIIVTKNGTTLATFNNIAVICQDKLTEDCRIELDAFTVGQEFPDFSTIDNLNYLIEFNEATRNITLTFATIDGSSPKVQMNVTKYDRFGNNTICDDISNSVTDTIICHIPESYGNVTVYLELFNNNKFIESRMYKIQEKLFSDEMEDEGYFYTLVLVLTIPFLFAGNLIGFLIGIFIGLLVSSLLLFYQQKTLLGVGSAIIWLLVLIGAVVWKINSGRNK